MHVSSTLMIHVVLVLMVLLKFLESMLFLIPFWRASPALVLECYEVVEGGFLYFDFLAPNLVSKVLNYSNNIFYNQQGQNRGKLLFTNVI